MDADANTTKTWENVVGYYKFTDVTVHPDGSVTYNESYVELNGNYTDANAADMIYLNQLRSTYTFIEVPMPWNNSTADFTDLIIDGIIKHITVL